MDIKGVVNEFRQYVEGFVECCESDRYTHELLRKVVEVIDEQDERIAIMEADAPRWYPASMKPEKDDEDYYCLTKDDGIIPLRFLDGEWGIFAECFVGDACSGEEWIGIEKLKIDFDYWMPMPKPPAQEETENEDN